MKFTKYFGKFGKKTLKTFMTPVQIADIKNIRHLCLKNDGKYSKKKDNQKIIHE